MKFVPDIDILPCLITMTRIAPRKLDAKENLPMSFKWFSDGLADYLKPGLAAGRADDDERMQWKFEQEKGEPKQYAIRIKIEKIPDAGFEPAKPPLPP